MNRMQQIEEQIEDAYVQIEQIDKKLFSWYTRDNTTDLKDEDISEVNDLEEEKEDLVKSIENLTLEKKELDYEDYSEEFHHYIYREWKDNF